MDLGWVDDVALADMTDADLLRRLIGARATQRLYQGSLQPLFSPSADGPKALERCAVARELVRRWLAEQLRAGPVLNSPAAVRD